MKYRLTSHVTVSAYTEVEADSEEEAIAQSKEREVVIGGRGSGTSPSEQWVIEDADGYPKNIKVDE